LITQPLLTPHQSRYYAWLLTRPAAGDTVESLASALVDSRVDLNLNQVEAPSAPAANATTTQQAGAGQKAKAGARRASRFGNADETV
jgi:hypothetical protein